MLPQAIFSNMACMLALTSNIIKLKLLDYETQPHPKDF